MLVKLKNSYGGTSKGSAFLSPKSNPQHNATDAVGN